MRSVFKARISDGNRKLLGVGNVGGVSGVVIALRIDNKAVRMAFACQKQARDAVRALLMPFRIEIAEEIIITERLGNECGEFRRCQMHGLFNAAFRQIEIRLFAFQIRFYNHRRTPYIDRACV